MDSKTHAQLDALVASAMGRAFDWRGQHCCQFAADWVRIQSGVDFSDLWSGVTTAREALRRIQEEGGLAEGVTKRLGDPVSPLSARYGDVVMVRSNAAEGVGDSLGICVGPSVLVTASHGLVRVPLSSGTKAWRSPACASRKGCSV